VKNIILFLFSYQGRITRSQFWLYYLVAIVWQLLSFAILSIDHIVAIAVGLILYFALIYSIFAVFGKRWHDRGKSAKWNFICLIPGLGAMWATIECGFFKGTEGKNKYGPDPKLKF
jgi:uncharacterized membrane protein YhaH (DUF805 family)